MLIEEDVGLKQRICAEDLEKAEPALVAAQAALDTLNKVISLLDSDCNKEFICITF